MLIRHDPDAYVAVSEGHTCAFHREYPGRQWAGCTCGGGVGLRTATPEEKAENRRRRLAKRREDLAAELAAIDAELAARRATQQETER